MKKLASLTGVKTLGRTAQKSINGGSAACTPGNECAGKQPGDSCYYGCHKGCPGECFSGYGCVPY